MSNLVENAVRHTGDGGRVSVVLGEIGSKVSIAVKDSGEGIQSNELRTLFRRSRSARRTKAEERKGLGLTIANKIAELHLGSIDVQSKLGLGTTITLAFPAAENTRKQAKFG